RPRVRRARGVRRRARAQRSRARGVPAGRAVPLRRAARFPGHGRDLPALVARHAGARPAAAAPPGGLLTAASARARESERGNMGWLRFALWLYRNGGRPLLMMVLVPITAYFVVLDRVCRRSSRDWLRTAYATPDGHAALRRQPGLYRTWRHVFGFSGIVA